MDKGAHFYKCDFQVHSPRDLNWKGQGATTPEECQSYAEEFIAACRKQEIGSVAITDHHDMGFFPFIQRAAAAELDFQGNPLPEEQKVVIFPGMELTLGVPCQAIIIFDADFPVDLLSTIPPLLAIPNQELKTDKHGEIRRLEHIKSFRQLYDLLDQQQHLRGKFFILPNVGENGQFSLLRKGFASHYKAMPCVGGYVDGNLDKLGDGNKNILDGKNKEWGFKSLGLFQTSDNRNRDYQLLGKHYTWVKWARPTAEGLRQACLAKDSRISQTEPLLPSVFITGIEVSNSKFLGPLNVELNAQFNAFIGGRGTGKSTILEYLRWALCDQPTVQAEEGELPDFQKRRKGLIAKTLEPYDSSVQVSFLLNNIPHTVRRYTKTSEILIKIGQEDFRKCNEEEVRNLLPIHAYSQKQLSNVGVKEDELKRFIHSPIKKQLDEYASKARELSSSIRNVYEIIQKKRVLELDIEKYRLELKSLSEQLANLRSGLKGVSEEDQKIIATQDKYTEEETSVDAWSSEIKTTEELLIALNTKVSEFPTKQTLSTDIPNYALISEMQREVESAFCQIKDYLSLALNSFNKASSTCLFRKFNEQHTNWINIKSQASQLYEEAKARSTSQNATLIQIQQLETRIKGLRTLLLEKDQNLTSMGSPTEKYTTLRLEWIKFHKERSTSLEDQCKNLTELSKEFIKASLERGAGVIEIENRLRELIKGSKIRGEKIETLLKIVKDSADPIEEWEKILMELERLSIIDAITNPSIQIPDTPILSAAGIGENERRKIAEKLNTQTWLDLSLIELEDLPNFKYRSRESEYIDFTDASAGQQATALMYVLLNQTGPPLIIDQPEDDLDNHVVKNIVQEIWRAKTRRQLIFSSHNANLVVNGDAELVICCDNRIAGDQTGGRISNQGAIDVEEIRKEITNVMEGGKDAFKLRQDKYGF